jgi:tetratricopeptide (TPR) repeat protein
MSNTSQLLSKYLLQFEKNQTSQVFAPLAESYRKMGMHKEAFDVLKKGLRHHPHYVLGLLVLGHCYFDVGKIEEAYKVIKPIVAHEPDNIKLQRLFGQICYKMYSYGDALTAYKNILYIYPSDEEAIRFVKELEDNEYNVQAYLAGQTKELDTPVELPRPPMEPDAWRSLEEESAPEKPVAPVMHGMPVMQAIDEWAIKQWSVDDAPDVPDVIEEIEVIEPAQAPQLGNSTSLDASKEESYENLDDGDDIPIVTHTLVDIYIAQKHTEKAINLLQKIVKKDPSDFRSQEKLAKLLGRSTKEAPVKEPAATQKKNSWTKSKHQVLGSKYKKYLDAVKDTLTE